jgi:CheY-like chemotaxis protein
VKRILVIEDGSEYEEFARLFLSVTFALEAAHSLGEALRALGNTRFDGFLIDLRFDRASEAELTGDVGETADRLFAGDRGEAVRYLKDHQGVLILAALRAAGHRQPAVFVHDFPKRQLDNLVSLYGAVSAVPSFDAAAIRRRLEASTSDG